MKVALCMTGYPATIAPVRGGLKENQRILDKSFESYKKRVFKYNDIDTYIHTWNSDFTNQYLRKFRPKEFIVEDQPEFDDLEKYLYLTKNKNGTKAIFAKAYAVKELLKIVPNVYDLYILTRPDISWLSNLRLEEHRLDRIYISYPTQKRISFPNKPFLADLIFVMSHDKLCIFASLLENLREYLESQKILELGIENLYGKKKAKKEITINNHVLYYHHLEQNKQLRHIVCRYRIKKDLTLTRQLLGHR